MRSVITQAASGLPKRWTSIHVLCTNTFSIYTNTVWNIEEQILHFGKILVGVFGSVITQVAGQQRLTKTQRVLCAHCKLDWKLLPVRNTYFEVLSAHCKPTQRRPNVYQNSRWQNLVLCVWSNSRELCVHWTVVVRGPPFDDGCSAWGSRGTLHSPHRWKLGAPQKIRLAGFWKKKNFGGLKNSVPLSHLSVWTPHAPCRY